ncbi:MAG: NosD domain-containing protein [Granulosicoccus sp.]
MSIIKHAVLKLTAVSLLIGGLVFASAANAAVFFSYSDDLSDSQQLDGAVVSAQTVWIFNTDSTAMTVQCCDWVAGPDSRDRFDKLNTTVAANASTSVDLSVYRNGSTRQLNYVAGGASGSLNFTVGRAPNSAVMALNDSGTVQASSNGQVIENLRINTAQDDFCAIVVDGKHDVIIRNIDLAHHQRGICVYNSNNVTIENVHVVSASAPEAGPHCDFGISNCYAPNKISAWADPFHRMNIIIQNSDDVLIEHARLEKGSSGIYLNTSKRSRLHDIQCLDARGPKSLGNCALWDKSPDGSIINFSIQNFKNISHVEDNLNMYDSDNGLVKHGYIDGNYSLYGVGVIADHGSDNLVVDDVDIMRTGVAAINVWAGDPVSNVGKNFTARNIRVRDTVCRGRHDVIPSSNGIAIATHPSAINPSITNTIYWNHCRDAVNWCISSSCRQAPGGVFDIREEEFTMREPLELRFDWDAATPEITGLSID